MKPMVIRKLESRDASDMRAFFQALGFSSSDFVNLKMV